MPALKPQSARSLNWFAAILLLAGWLVPAPAAALLLSVLALLTVLAPALFGAGRARIVALILGVLAIGTAVDAYPQFQREQARYIQRARERAVEPAPVPGAPVPGAPAPAAPAAAAPVPAAPAADEAKK